MKRSLFAVWQVIALFAGIGLVLVVVQRTNAPLVPKGTSSSASIQPQENTFRIPSKPYIVPRDGKKHDIRITVITTDGSEMLYSRQHRGGEGVQIESPLPKGAWVRLYDNAELRGELKL